MEQTSTSRKILILGGSDAQLPVYREAKAMGLHIIGVDKNPNCVARAFTDQFLEISIRDYEEIFLALSGQKIDAVIGPGSDMSQASVYHLSRLWNCPFQPSKKSVLASMNKGFFLELLKKDGLPHVQFFQSTDRESLMQFVSTVGYPIVVKPSDAAGSKGIRVVRSPSELSDAIDEAFSHSASKQVIIETFQEGRHYSCDVMVAKGHIVFMATSQKSLSAEPLMIPVGHRMPAALGSHDDSSLRATLQRVIDLLEIDSGPCNFDVVIDDMGSIYVIEIGARLAANGMPILIQAVYGINTISMAIKLAFGMNVHIPDTKVSANAAMLLIYSNSGGFLDSVQTFVERRMEPQRRGDLLMNQIEIYKEHGDPIEALTGSHQKIGYQFIVTKSDETLSKLSDIAKNLLKVKLKEKKAG